MIAPTSMDDAWPLRATAWGLWAGVSSLEAYADQPPSLSLLATAAADATPAVWNRSGSEFALVFTPSRDAELSDRRGTPQLALVAASGGAPTVQPIEPLRGNVPRLLAWSPDGSTLALVAYDEDSGNPSIWLIPARRPADARRLEKDVRCFSWGGLGFEGMMGLSQTLWLQ
jgi:Tol biopolymer transport system component